MQNLLLNFLNIFTSLMGKEITDPDLLADHPWLETVVNPILGILDALLVPLLIVVGTAGSIYAVVLGVNYARAETSDKREEAKKRMINAVIGIVVMVFLLVVLQLFVANADTIVEWIGGVGEASSTTTTTSVIKHFLNIR